MRVSYLWLRGLRSILLVSLCLVRLSGCDFNIDNIKPDSDLLKALLVPRTVGSASHLSVQNFLITRFTENGWSFSHDTFEAKTPLGTKQFKNLIFTLHPHRPKKILIAAHYDLKSSMPSGFMGAIDAAWSCTFLTEMGYRLANRPCGLHERLDLTPQIVFFDGEEAFKSWSTTDSLYGSRHLASSWDASGALNSIELFILLDLLGATGMRIPNYFARTKHLHEYIANLEDELMSRHQISVSNFIRRDCLHCNVQDDHIPFLRLGVPVLHIIPQQFPSVWHTAKDDKNAIDIKSSISIALTILAFVSDYLDALIRV